MDSRSRSGAGVLAAAWVVTFAAAALVRVWNALEIDLLYGYDAWGHVGYVLFLDLWEALPWADQGWSYFHPPLHYLLGWALAQAGSSEFLLRGLALWGGVASLLIAWLAARVTRRAAPERPALALAAFAAVAFLPVHLYVAPMNGNELTAALWSSLALAALVANEARDEPTRSGDALIGAACGLALLTKFSGALTLATALVVVVARGRETGPGARLARAAVIATAALLLAGPWYARNALEYGTPFRLSRSDSLVGEVEAGHPPGARSWVDFVSVSPRLLSEPEPRAPHLLHSVWGTLYVNAWTDTRIFWRQADAEIRGVWSALAVLGIVPTALALAGAVLAMRDVRRGRRAAVYLPLLVSSGLHLVGFAAFAAAVPIFTALKASYLLGASLAYGAFVARGIEALTGGAARGASALLAVSCTVAALVYSTGVVLPRLGEYPPLGAVRFYFEEYEAAEAQYRELLHSRPGLAPIWRENLAALALASGDVAQALEHHARLPVRSGSDAWSANQLAVAMALAGDLEAARTLFDLAIARGGGAVPTANRGMLRAVAGDAEAAARDLREALALDPALVPARHALAVVAARLGEPEGDRDAARVPRGWPYGLGAGLGQRDDPRIGMRWLLRLDGDALRLARPPWE